MKIALVTPAGAGSRAGNRHTALRWAAMLRAAGHRVSVATRWNPGRAADMLIALHARRSHASVRAFATAHPDRPLLLALTGTDLYRDVRTSAKARASLALAHRLIGLQRMAARELPPALRRKLSVVVQSCASRLKRRPVRRRFRIAVIGHLRQEKDPLRALAALRRIPRTHAIEVVQLGAALDPSLAAAARAGMRAEPRYRWLGSVPHHRALRWLASSHALVVSSRMEGGANVVSEAIRLGVPVLASRIPGNLGLLGESYPGCFAPEDDRALADLMLRAQSDERFYRRLCEHVRTLRPEVAPAAESRSLLSAVRACAQAASAAGSGHPAHGRERTPVNRRRSQPRK